MRTLIAVFVLALVFINNSYVLAQENDFGVVYEDINPVDRGDYAVKRMREKVKLFFLSVAPHKKASFYHELINRRFSELVFIVESKDENQIEKASNRYFTTVGQTAEYVESKNWQSKESIKDTLSKQIEIMPQLIDKYPANSAGWLFLKQDLDYARAYKDRL